MSSVYIVEDSCEITDKLTDAIAAADELELLGHASTLHAARSALGTRLPDVALVDLGLPDGDACGLISWLSTQPVPVECLVLSVFGDEHHVVTAIEAGASGYLLKGEALDEIVSQIELVLDGGSPISPAVARYILRRLQPRESRKAAAAPRLTPTELEIMHLIAKGYSSNEIAGLTDRSMATVPGHIKNIYRKLAVHSRAQAVYEALQLGLIPGR